MNEFDSVSVSTSEASSLAAKLTEKAGDGWDVVAIVPTGTEVTAFLKRQGSASSTTSAVTADAASTWGTDAAATPVATVSEPAGWGSAPESSTTSWGSSTDTTAGTPASTTPTGSGSSSWGSSSATTPAASSPATPAVPAGWYSDPATRYELRYWDGSAWTEHVSRAGQQYTDPPVA